MIDTIARLMASDDLQFVDLYVPVEVWKELTRQIHGNKLTVCLRLEGEDGTPILDALKVKE